MKYKFIDLFAGIGGMRLGFESACEELGFEADCVFSSEWDIKCQDTYMDNFKERPDGDISYIVENEIHKIKKHDVLMAGFPCQPFSQAGLRMGFEDTRGTLFHDIAIILKERKLMLSSMEIEESNYKLIILELISYLLPAEKFLVHTSGKMVLRKPSTWHIWISLTTRV